LDKLERYIWSSRQIYGDFVGFCVQAFLAAGVDLYYLPYKVVKIYSIA